jgi:hypothetical protein
MEPPLPPQQLNERVERGKQFAEMLWWQLAKRIVRLAGEHYLWTDEQWLTATEIFLRPSDYQVIPK